MKIAFNPSTVAALITPPNNKDITFDLRGRNIFARGVKFCGTDTWRDIKINNVSIDSNILDLRNGSNTTLTNTNGVVTINSTWRPVVDNLTSDSTTSSLSANQGRVLKALIDGKSDSDHNHDSRYVKKTGDTMSGVLTIDTTNFGALTIKRNDDANGASIQFRGKSSVYGYIGLNNSTKDKQFLRWNSDTSKTYIILDTSSTYTSNGKGIINGTTITQVDNATNSTNSTNARKLVNWYSDRPTSLNTQFGDGSLRIFYATSSTTEGKCPSDASILHLAWDNNEGWDTLLALAPRENKMYFRGQHSGTWQPWKTLAFTTDIPSSLKNPYSLTTFGVVYDGSAAKVVSPSNFISQVNEGTATVTDGTMFITSYASNSGFADTNAVNVPYKRKAIHLWEYIKVKTDSLYTTKSHNHDDRYVRAFGTSNDNIDSDWGLSFKTFDPIPSGTPPEKNPNISILNIGNSFNRRKLLAFIYSNDNIYYRRHVDNSFTNWRRLAFANEIPTSLKNPYALTISLNGTSLGPYDGSAAKNVNITPGSIGAATSNHIHPYLPLSGGTVTGNIILKGRTSTDMTYAGNVHPYIRFDNSDSSLNVSLIFTDYDTYRRPAGIKLVGNQGNEWFEAANIYATTFYGALSGNASSATNADKVDGYHASAFVKIKLFRFNQYNQGTWTKILTITINSTADLLPVIAFSWIPSECNREIWADFSISWRSNSPIFYAIWKGMNSRTLKVVNSSGAIWDVWVSGNKNGWDPFGEIQVTYTHNIASYNGGSLEYSDTDPGGTICITGGQVNYANSAGSATKVIVNLHTTDDTNYPLVWSNLNNSNSVTENQLYKSWSDLYYNPKNKRLTVGGSVVASSFIKSGGTSLQLLRADGGIATFNWLGQSGLPTWLWGGNNLHSYYIYNPSNFRVAYAETAGSADNIGGVSLSGIFTAFGNNNHNITATIGGVTKEFQVNYASNADKLDGYHENSFLRYRETTSIDLENTLWDLIGIKLYNGALPDNLTNVYNYGSVISLPCTSTRFEIYASELASLGNGLYYRSGWRDTKRPWLKFIDSSNIGSQSVNYANSAGNADTVDGEHANNFVRAGHYNSTDLNSLDTYSFIRSVNSQVSSTSPKGNTGWYNVILAVHRNGTDDGPNYMGLIALGMTTNRDDMFFRTKYENTWNSWKTVIHSGNYTEFINNYYWANVKISASASTTTSPTVLNLTATNSIRMSNISLEHTDEINNSANGGINLNYRNSGNVSLCLGGGNVGIGTMGPSYKLDVNGLVRASGFHHASHNNDDAVLLAGGGYSQGVPVKYWSIESISIYGPTLVFRVNRGGNYTFVTKVEPRIKGSCVLTLQFPSGYYYDNTIIWARGVLNNDISDSSNSTIYATIFQFSESKYYLNLSDDDSLNNGTCQLYFMCF